MLWNDTELQNLYGLGKEIVVERFMKNLDAPENGDLFQKENFSYLWGLIGIAGIKGTSPLVRHKIWNALLQFGVVDAFDKGQLSDFNRNLALNCSFCKRCLKRQIRVLYAANFR